MKTYTLLFLFSILCLTVSSQNINFTLPSEANKHFVFYVSNGLKADTIATGTISVVGTANLAVPERYASIPAMGTLVIEKAEPIYIILNGESFSVALSADKKLEFRGSVENDLFYSRQNEVMKQEYSSTYAQSYVKTMSALTRMMSVVQQQGKASPPDTQSAREAAVEAVDVDKLYYGRFWYFIIDNLLRLSSTQEEFANDMIRLLDKTKTDKVYLALVQDLITLTNQYGLDDAFDIIIPHVKKSKRIEYPQGDVFDAFLMAKILKGTKIPDLVGLSKSDVKFDYMLLIFYHPDCDNCHEQLADLKANYDFFTKRKVRVISISGDTSQNSFNEEIKKYPWPDKLCDYKGYAGANFQNYAIIGTPTIYLVDGNNIVLGRLSKISDVINRLIE